MFDWMPPVALTSTGDRVPSQPSDNGMNVFASSLRTPSTFNRMPPLLQSDISAPELISQSLMAVDGGCHDCTLKDQQIHNLRMALKQTTDDNEALLQKLQELQNKHSDSGIIFLA
jgi:hypothetical protein